MRVVKPQRLSVLQRAFEVRGERIFAVGLAAYTPFEAPDHPLAEAAMWKEVASAMGKDGALDEGLPKPRGEFLVFGTAFAPGGAPRPGFSVRARVGSLDKTVYAVGKRRWVRGVPTEPEPLTELALGWAHAFGGPGFTANPIGTGFAPVDEGGEKIHWLPRLEDPKRLVTSPSERPTPAAFGPIDAGWSTRQGLLGTYDTRWLEQDFPGFARDIDPDYFQLASADQRLPQGYFQGGESIELEHLHAREPRIASRVTNLLARCFITRRGAEGALESIPMRLETVVLFPNIHRMVSLFRGVTRVAEDDAADVACLLAALELRAAPKPIEHYQAMLSLRLDKEKGYLVGLRDRDFLPAPDPDEPRFGEEPDSDLAELMRKEGVLERRGHARAERELEQSRRSLRVFGFDPDAHDLPRAVPPPEQPPSLDELPEYMERIEAEVEKLKADVAVKEAEAKDQARAALAEVGLDLDEEIARAQARDGRPTFRAAEHLEQLRATAAAAREGGSPLVDLEAKLDDPRFVKDLERTEEAQLVGYRLGAHHMPPAQPLDEAARDEMRTRVVAALAEQRSMRGWDLTCADLSGIDFAKADLREALLEGAKLTGAKLAGANLTRAVLARADLGDAALQGADLTEANLGDVSAHGADLTGVRLGKATLFRSDLAGARLGGAQIEAADFFEAKLAGADLSGIAANGTLFYGCDLHGAKLDGARLAKAQFVKCNLEDASFARANLEQATFVEVEASRASFRGAHANNLRFVQSEHAGGVDFAGAEIALGTLRSLDLRGASFANASAEGLDVSESDVREAKFDGARLRGARMVRSDLGGASLVDADLMEGMLQGAKVHGATFERANLFRANLMGAEGDAKTSFRDAHVVRTLFMREKR